MDNGFAAALLERDQEAAIARDVIFARPVLSNGAANSSRAADTAASGEEVNATDMKRFPVRYRISRPFDDHVASFPP